MKLFQLSIADLKEVREQLLAQLVDADQAGDKKAKLAIKEKRDLVKAEIERRIGSIEY